MKSKDLGEKRVYEKSKTRLQLLLVDHDGILCRDLVIHTNAWRWSKDIKGFLRDVVLIVQTVHVLLS